MQHDKAQGSRRRLAPTLAFTVVAAGLGALALANVRLINPGNGNPLFWNTSNVSIVINSTGSDDITDGSHVTAVRNGIDEWNSVTGKTISLVEDTNPAQQARTDYTATDMHLVLFDETNSSGYFPGGSGTVAITPIWFFASGTISDADILFNGSGFTFGTDGPGFDVQDVFTHELGHFLGFEHTASAGATMYPYVDASVILHRSIAVDEECGLRAMYPASTPAAVQGTVKRTSDSSGVGGAHVGVWDAGGRSAATALASATGDFKISGLDAGSYTLYVTPFEGPASSSNLSPGHTVQTDFESRVVGSVVIGSGATTVVGDVFVDADVSISFGRTTDIFPKRVLIDDTTRVTIHGSGLALATLTCSDPALTLTPVLRTNSQFVFDVAVPMGAETGHVDLIVDSGGDVSLLPLGLEVTPADPVVTSVSPAQVDGSGGTPITISGADFGPGSRVVIGSNIYVDGEPGGCNVVDRNTITLTTAATAIATYDVVVIDDTGVEGRLSSGLEFASLPVIDTVFPVAGSAAGGTPVELTGENFLSGVTVTINGIVQTNLNLVSSTRLSLMTEPGLAGGPYTLEVRNSGGGAATSLFSYSATADPEVTAVSPAAGPTAGGTLVTLTGTDFTATTDVVFGVNPLTGQGGVPAASVTFVDSNTLEVETPSFGAGSHSILAFESSSGQAAVVLSGFTFLAPPSSGGGGGCQARPGRSDPLDAALGLLGLAGAYAYLLWRQRAHARERA